MKYEADMDRRQRKALEGVTEGEKKKDKQDPEKTGTVSKDVRIPSFISKPSFGGLGDSSQSAAGKISDFIKNIEVNSPSTR